MNKTTHLPIILLILAALACGPLGSASISQPEAPVAPITIGENLNQIDLCQAIPPEAIEAVMGRKLVSAPERLEYYDSSGTSGCSYGEDSSGNAYFGYVILTPLEFYNSQPLYQNVDVSGIGDSAYFNNGANARQLWVKIDNKVAFGDQPNEDGATAIAKLVAAAIQ